MLASALTIVFPLAQVGAVLYFKSFILEFGGRGPVQAYVIAFGFAREANQLYSCLRYALAELNDNPSVYIDRDMSSVDRLH